MTKTPEDSEKDDEERRFEERWSRDHANDVPRTASGALPTSVLVIAVGIFVLGFWLFRRWRQQYVDYSNIGGWAEPIQPVLLMLGIT